MTRTLTTRRMVRINGVPVLDDVDRWRIDEARVRSRDLEVIRTSRFRRVDPNDRVLRTQIWLPDYSTYFKVRRVDEFTVRWTLGMAAQRAKHRCG